MQKIQLKVLNRRFAEKFSLPAYATDGSAAMDLRACLEETLTVKLDGCELIPTGLAIHIDDSSICAVLLPRSGLGRRASNCGMGGECTADLLLGRIHRLVLLIDIRRALTL